MKYRQILIGVGILVIAAGCVMLVLKVKDYYAGEEVVREGEHEEYVEAIVEQPAPTAKIDRKFIFATVADLKLNEGGWIPKDAVIVDSQRNAWLDVSQPVTWSIDEENPNTEESRLLKVWATQEGYAVGLPQVHYERNKDHFLWTPQDPDPSFSEVASVQLPIAGEARFMPKRIVDLREGEGCWIAKTALSVDLDRKLWLDVSRRIETPVGDDEYRVMWCKKGPAGYEVYIPRDNYERNSWFFQWEPSPLHFNNPHSKRSVVIFTVLPKIGVQPPAKPQRETLPQELPPDMPPEASQ